MHCLASIPRLNPQGGRWYVWHVRLYSYVPYVPKWDVVLRSWPGRQEVRMRMSTSPPQLSMFHSSLSPLHAYVPLHSNTLYAQVTLVLMGCIGNAMGLAVGVCLNKVEFTINTVPLVLLPLIIFCGFFQVLSRCQGQGRSLVEPSFSQVYGADCFPGSLWAPH